MSDNRIPLKVGIWQGIRYLMYRWLALVMLPALPAWGANLFVDPVITPCPNYSAQQRNCSGTDGAAFGTIQSALARVKPGDTVSIRAGVYREVLNLGRSGREGEPIVLQNFADERVVIDGDGRLPSVPQGLLRIDNQQFVTVTGLSFSNSRYYGITAANSRHIQIIDCQVSYTEHGGIVFENGYNILVDRCEVHHTNQLGGEAWHEAVSFENTDTFEISNSKVHDNKKEGIDAKYNARNGLIHHNETFRNGSANIYIDAAHHIDIYNNRIYSNTLADRPGMSIAVEATWNRRQDNTHHIRLYNNIIYDNTVGLSFWIEEGAGRFARLHDILIANNVFHDNNRNNWGAIFFINGSLANYGENNSIINNIFWDNTRSDGWSRSLLDMAGVLEKFKVRHNLFKAGEPSSTYGENPVLAAEAGFVDARNRDYRIRENSPARDAGIAHAVVRDDFAGNARPATGPIDIGAYEIQIQIPD